MGQRGLHTVLEQVLNSSIDEALEGHASQIQVTLKPDRVIEVVDDGPGIPVTLSKRGKSVLEVLFSELASRFSDWGPGHRQSVSGVGVAIVNALSEWLEVEVTREGSRYRMRFERGEPVGGLQDRGEADRPGTRIVFAPDPQIFAPALEFDITLLTERLRALSALLPDVTLGLEDQRHPPSRHQTFTSPRGLEDLLHSIVEQPLLPVPISLTTTLALGDERLDLSVAIQAEPRAGRRLFGFVNLARIDDGSHVAGLEEGLESGLRAAGQCAGAPWHGQPGGVTGVIAVGIPCPAFQGARGQRLHAPELRPTVAQAVHDLIVSWASNHPRSLKTLLATD